MRMCVDETQRSNSQTANTGVTIVLAENETVHAAQSKHIEKVPWRRANPTSNQHLSAAFKAFQQIL